MLKKIFKTVTFMSQSFKKEELLQLEFWLQCNYTFMNTLFNSSILLCKKHKCLKKAKDLLKFYLSFPSISFKHNIQALLTVN